MTGSGGGVAVAKSMADAFGFAAEALGRKVRRSFSTDESRASKSSAAALCRVRFGNRDKWQHENQDQKTDDEEDQEFHLFIRFGRIFRLLRRMIPALRADC